MQCDLAMPASRVLLVSPPWRLGGWPSLALGVLKAHLLDQGIAVHALHLHFEVAMRLGWARYQEIAAGWELGEALYFSLYAPDEADAILLRTARRMRDNGQDAQADWANRELLGEVESATLEVVDTLDLSSYDIVGFSVGALQLGASLYLGQLFKRRAPHLKIVLGGGSVLGEPGARLLQHVAWIDAVVDGEGETALAALAAARIWDEALFKQVPNLRYRRTDGSVVRTDTRVLGNLDAVIPPDMDEFYAAAHVAGLPASELLLPIEASRGCAWEHRRAGGELRGCTFCGLYRNSPNFRERQLETVIAQIRDGAMRYRALELGFIDAYLPPSYAKELLKRIAEEKLDVTLFCEMRCDLDEEMASLLARAGARKVQLGVEAFHTGLLARMAKGVRMIDNVASIKLCEEYGVPHQYNLITHFPGASARDVNEMCQLLPSLVGFKPPSLADFYLDRGSRIYADPRAFGIEPESMDRAPLAFLPAALASARICQVVPYEAPESDELRAAWASVDAAVVAWRERHRQARVEGVSQLLSYRDTGDALVVYDQRGEEPQVVTLKGLARDVLLSCDRLIRKSELLKRLPALEEGTLATVLLSLRTHRLVIEEGAWMLGLAVRTRLPNGAPRAWVDKCSTQAA